MSKTKVVVIKSPIIPFKGIDEEMTIYNNQVTYSVRLSNGMVITRPEEYPNDKDDQVDLFEAKEEIA